MPAAGEALSYLVHTHCGVESLDQYFTMERGAFIDPDNDTRALIDAMNTNARSGYKEIYEVIQ